MGPIHFQEASGKDIYLYPIGKLLDVINRDIQTYRLWEDAEIIPAEFVIKVKLFKNRPPIRFFTDVSIAKFRKWFKSVKPKSKISAARRLQIRRLLESEFNRVKRAKYVGQISYVQIKEKLTEQQEQRRAEYFAEGLDTDDENEMHKGDWSVT
jgi:hypothetical protein